MSIGRVSLQPHDKYEKKSIKMGSVVGADMGSFISQSRDGNTHSGGVGAGNYKIKNKELNLGKKDKMSLYWMSHSVLLNQVQNKNFTYNSRASTVCLAGRG